MDIFSPKEEISGYRIGCKRVWKPEHGLEWSVRKTKLDMWASPQDWVHGGMMTNMRLSMKQFRNGLPQNRVSG